MKIGNQRLIEAIIELDPAACSFVNSLTLHLEGGGRFVTDNVTVDNIMLWADEHDNHGNWLYVPIDQIIGFRAALNPKACAEKKVSTLPEIIKYCQEN